MKKDIAKYNLNVPDEKEMEIRLNNTDNINEIKMLMIVFLRPNLVATVLALRFGRKQRLKSPRYCFRVHADTVVFHLDTNNSV